MSDKPTSSGFDPNVYVPKPVPGVEIIDRGKSHPDTRYALIRETSENVVIIAADDRRIWDMFDGEKTVNDICGEYLVRHRTLVLNRVFTLLQRLWEGGLLQEDPRIAVTDDEQDTSLTSWSLSNWGRWPIPGLANIAKLISPAIRAARIDTIPAMVTLTIVIFAGFAAVGQFYQASTFPIFRLSQPYDLFDAETFSLKRAYVYGIFLLFVLHMICSLLRQIVQVAVEGAFCGKFSTIRLVINYGIPSFGHSAKWRLTLPPGQRIVAGLSGIYFEMLAAGACAILVGFALPEMYHELVYKLMWVFYLRVFFHFSPFIATDLCAMTAEWSNQSKFRARAFGFLRHNLLNALFGDDRLSREQRIYLTFNVVFIFWLGLIAKVTLDLFTTNQQAVRDITFFIGGGDGTLARLILGAFVLPILLATLGAFVWAICLLAEWLRGKPYLQRANNVVLVVVVVMALLPASIAVLGRLVDFDPANQLRLMLALNIIAAVTALAFLYRSYRAAGSSTLSLRIGFLAAAVLCLGFSSLISIANGSTTHLKAIFILLIANVAIGLVIGATRGQNVLSHGKTVFAFSELVILMGSLLLAFAAYTGYQIASGSPNTVAPIRVQRVAFIALSFVTVGVAAFHMLLKQIREPSDSLAIDDPEQEPVKSLIRIFNYVVEDIGAMISQTLGKPVASALAARVRKETPCSEFSFEDCAFPEKSEPAAVGEDYRAALVLIRNRLATAYGAQYADALFSNVFARVHWESKILLTKYVLSGTPWDGAFKHECEFGAENRMNALDRITFFADLDTEEKRLLANRLVLQRFEPNELIGRQGEFGDACFIITEGEVQVEERDKIGQHRILAFLREGDMLGEAALLENTPRMASIRASIATTVLTLYSRDLEIFAKQRPKTVERIKERLRNMQLLLHVPLFADVSANLLRLVVPHITPMRFEKGQDIVVKGDTGRDFYLVKSGKVTVLAIDGEHEEEVCDLGPRDYFGEIALLREIPRTATVRAGEETEVLRLDKETFDRLTAGSALFTANLKALGERRLEELGDRAN